MMMIRETLGCSATTTKKMAGRLDHLAVLYNIQIQKAGAGGYMIHHQVFPASDLERYAAVDTKRMPPTIDGTKSLLDLAAYEPTNLIGILDVVTPARG